MSFSYIFIYLICYVKQAEKAKHDEKETKKLQDSLQAVQLRLSAREHICRTLQEKVHELACKLIAVINETGSHIEVANGQVGQWVQILMNIFVWVKLG